MRAFRNSISISGPLADLLEASNGSRGSLKFPLNTVKFPNTPHGAQTPFGEMLAFVSLNECVSHDQNNDRGTFDAAGIRVPKVRKTICVSDAASHAH